MTLASRIVPLAVLTLGSTVLIAPGISAQPAAFAVGDRVADGAPNGLKGVIVRIGGAGDPTYYQGCYAIHFDYESYDPSKVEWTCLNTGSKLFKLGAGNQAAAQPAPTFQPAPAMQPAAPQVMQPVVQQPRPAPAPMPVAAPVLGGNIGTGTYECYGTSSPMGGFNFAITGPGTYSDVTGVAGSYSVAGGMMTFHGGAHDGQKATYFPKLDARHPAYIAFENTLGGGLGISCDAKA
jgi:hypothetical protein